MNLAYVLAELTRRPRRTLAGLLSVALGVALFLALGAYAGGYRQAARAPLELIGADIVAQRQGVAPEAFEGLLFPHSTGPVYRDEVESIRRVAGVQALSEAVFFWYFETNRFVMGLGLDPEQSVGPGRLRTALLEGRFLEPGERGVAVADAGFATQARLAVGDRVAIAGQPFTVVGIADTARAGRLFSANLYLPLADARALALAAANVKAVYDFAADTANMLFIRADPARGPAVAAEVEQLLGKNALVTTPQSFAEELGAGFSLVDRFGLLVGMAGLLVAMLGLVRTVAAGLWERRRDVALMRAVGWQRGQVVRQLGAEALVLTGLGTAAGLLLAALAGWILGFTRVAIPVPWEMSPRPHFLSGGFDQVAVTVPLTANVSSEQVLVVLALAMLGGGLVSLWLAGRASGIKPAEVWRSE